MHLLAQGGCLRTNKFADVNGGKPWIRTNDDCSHRRSNQSNATHSVAKNSQRLILLREMIGKIAAKKERNLSCDFGADCAKQWL